MKVHTNTEPISQDILNIDLAENEALMRQVFNRCFDIVYQTYCLHNHSILMIYVNGLVDTTIFDPTLIASWLSAKLGSEGENESSTSSLKKQFPALRSIEYSHYVSAIVEGILQSKLAIIVDGESEALLLDISGMEHRGVEEPASEITIRGSRESFTETLTTNSALVRRRIQTPELKLESVSIGQLSKTKIAIAYLEGTARSEVINLVKQRLSVIHIKAVLESGYIEEFIEDKSFTPFPQILNTERPDIVAANLLEGKVAILTDGTPNALIVPMTFWTAFQSAEDYYERFLYSTLVRWTRFILFTITLFLPSLFVAVTTFHPQLLPTNFLLSITSAREGVPFPSLIEALLMEFLFEGLREAGVRLPKAVGSAVSIVGALVIGQAAVQAGIVSAPMVIIVSLTGIASFAIPRYNMGIAFRILRFPLLLLSGALGLYGIVMGTIIIMIHLTKLESFGVPYLSPIAPMSVSDLKDILIRAPWWGMDSLSESIISRLRRR